MKVPSATDKPKNNIDLLAGNSEAVKVNTRSNSHASEVGKERAAIAHTFGNTENLSERAASVKLGLSKYISEELDPQKVNAERQAKIADIKARIANGNYLQSINSEEVSSAILEESRLENLIVENE